MTADANRGARVRRRLPELLLLALLLALAAAVRWSHLWLIPHFTDEMRDVDLAWRIFAEGARPLVSVDAYNGPLHDYLLAAALVLLGPSMYVPRLVMLVAGTATVGVTYLLGRAMGSRLAGAVAAGLLATNFVHVLINSHVAWSNCLTPLFTTLAMLVVVQAVQRGSGWRLALGGLLAGLALQTHPSAVVPLLGLAVWLPTQRRGRAFFRTPWPYLALALTALAVSNLVWFNLQTGGGALANVEERRYAFTGGADVAGYVTNVGRFGLGLAMMLSSEFGQKIDAGWRILAQPVVALWVALVGVAVLVAARRGQSLPLVVLGTAWLTIPYLNQSYGSTVMSRYIAFLLPPLYVAVGLWVADLARTRRRAALALALVVAALGLNAWRVTERYYAAETAVGRTNAALLATTRYLVGQAPKSEVLLGRNLNTRALRAGGHVYRALDVLLLLEGVPHDGRRLEDIQADLPAMAPPVFLALTDPERDDLARRFRLVPVDDGRPTPEQPGGWRLYRLDDTRPGQ
jgi:4-amino-4-deoxy-L-arabinose transferase-like glycosyltransferase